MAAASVPVTLPTLPMDSAASAEAEARRLHGILADTLRGYGAIAAGSIGYGSAARAVVATTARPRHLPLLVVPPPGVPPHYARPADAVDELLPRPLHTTGCSAAWGGVNGVLVDTLHGYGATAAGFIGYGSAARATATATMGGYGGSGLASSRFVHAVELLGGGTLVQYLMYRTVKSTDKSAGREKRERREKGEKEDRMEKVAHR